MSRFLIPLLYAWTGLSFLIIIALLRVIVRGTKRPHKPLQSGATPLPATNFQGNARTDNPETGLGETRSGDTKLQERETKPERALILGHLHVFPSAHSHTNAKGGCGDESEPEKLTAVAGSSPAPIRHCPACDFPVEPYEEYCPKCDHEFSWRMGL